MDKFNQKWVRIFCLFRSKTWAITLGQTTFYSASKEFVSEDLKWQRHENKHKEQWEKEGLFFFPLKYLFYSIRYGYKNNPYEIEARSCE